MRYLDLERARSRFMAIRQSSADGLHPSLGLAPSPPRRRFLQAAGAASIAPLVWSSAGASPIGDALTYEDGNVFALLDGERPLFALDIRRFDGTPRARWERTADGFRLHLSDALFPGTSLRADCVLEFARDAEWDVRARLRETPFSDWSPVATWSSGQSLLVLPPQRLSLQRLSGALDFRLDSQSAVRLDARLGWRVAGGPSAVFLSDVHALSASEVRLSAEIGAPDPFSVGGLRHTRIELGGLKLSSPIRWNTDEVEASFDSSPSAGVLNICKGDSPVCWELRWDREFSGMLRPAFADTQRFPETSAAALASAALLGAYTSTESETAVIGTFRRQAALFSSEHATVGFEASDSHPFVAVRGDGSSFSFVDSVRNFLLRTPGADRAELTRGKSPIENRPDVTSSGVSIRKDTLKIVFTEQDVVQVERFRDQLELKVRFRNVQLVTINGLLWLSRVDPSKDALLSFELPPQHLAEEAFFSIDGVDPATYNKENKLSPAGCMVVGVPLNERVFTGRDADFAKEKSARDADQGQKPACDGLGGPQITTTPVKAQLSGPTHLAFKMLKPIAFSLSEKEGLLAWSADAPSDPSRKVLEPVVDPRALPDTWDVPRVAGESDEKWKKRRDDLVDEEKEVRGRPEIGPDRFVTSLELPYRLGISPVRDSRWHLSSYARTAGTGRFELWNARAISTGRDGRPAGTLSIRALWSPDFNPAVYEGKDDLRPHDHVPFRMSMDARDRHEIVALSGVYGQGALYPIVVDQTKSYSVAPSVRLGEEQSLNPQFKFGTYVPRPINTELLVVSPYGGWLKSRGQWEPPALRRPGDMRAENPLALTVEEWRHIAAMGRDLFVRMVYKGFLFPLGHRASVVKVTERKFGRDQKGKVTAFLYQRMFIIIGAPEKKFAALYQPYDSRAWPARKVTFLKTTTPDIMDPTEDNADLPSLARPKKDEEEQAKVRRGAGGLEFFWPRRPMPGGGKRPIDFYYQFETDSGKANAASPLMWLSNTTAHSVDLMERVYASYDRLVTEGQLHAQDDDFKLDTELKFPYGVAILGGSRVTYADSLRAGDTDFKTSRVLLGYHRLAPMDPTKAPDLKTQKPGRWTMDSLMEGESQPPFYPRVQVASVTLESLKALGSGNGEVDIGYDQRYLDYGFDSSENKGEVFARVVGGNAQLDASKDSSRTGGVAAPNLRVAALSRQIGFVGGPPPPPPPAPGTPTPTTTVDTALSIQRNQFDPRQFFDGALADAKLLGVVALKDVIAFSASAIDAAPKVIEKIDYGLNAECQKAYKNLIDNREAWSTSIGLLERNKRISNLTALRQSLGALKDALDGLPKKVPGCTTTVASLGPFVAAGKAVVAQIDAIVRNPLTVLANEVDNYKNFVTGAEALRVALAATNNFALRRLTDAAPFVESTRAWLDEVHASLRNEGESRVLASTILYAQRAARIVEVMESLKGLPPQDVVAQLVDQYVPPGLVVKPIADASLQLRERLVSWQLRCEDGLKAIEDAFTALKDNYGAYESVFAAKRAVLMGLRSQALGSVRDIKVALDLAVEALNLPNHAAAADAVLSALRAALQAVTTVRQALTLALAWSESAGQVGASGTDFASGAANLAKDLTQVRVDAWDGVRVAVAMNEMGKKPTVPTDKMQILRAASAVLAVDARQRFTLEEAAAREIFRAIDEKRIDPPLLEAWARARVERCASLVVIADAIKNSGAVENIRTIAMPAALVLAQVGLVVAEKARQAAVVIRQVSGAQKTHPILSATVFAQIDQIAIVIEAGATKLEGAATLVQAGNLSQLSELVKTFDELGKQVVQLASLGRVVADVLSKVADEAINQELANFKAKLEADLIVAIGVIPSALTLKHSWDTALKSVGGIFVAREGDGGEDTSRLTIDAELSVPTLTPERGVQSKISGAISPFQIQLLGSAPFLVIYFDEFRFESHNGSSPDFKVKVKRVKLNPPLDFVQKFEAILSTKSGPYVSLSYNPLGIECGYRLPLANFSAGGFDITNLGLLVAILLPFENIPAKFVLQVSTRQSPFLLSSGIYGGGGFIRMVMRPEGVDLIEGSFEFGAVRPINFGPLSGHGRITAGIYFRFERSTAVVCGFVQAVGCGRLGPFGIGIYIGVRICSENGQVTGQATYSVSFEMGLASITFTFTASYGFGDSSSRTAFIAPFNPMAALATGAYVGDCEAEKAPTVDMTDPVIWREHRQRFIPFARK